MQLQILVLRQKILILVTCPKAATAVMVDRKTKDLSFQIGQYIDKPIVD